MNPSRKIMIVGGLVLVVAGMVFGLWYAVFAEHQQLEAMGKHLATGFALAAERKLPEAHSAIHSYAASHYDYVRNVDVHSHWGGLAVLLIVLGTVFHRVGFRESTRQLLAAAFVLGAFLFPLAVVLETVDHGRWPQALAVIGSALVIGALSLIALGFMRGKDPESI
jgi:hypothetical protein